MAYISLYRKYRPQNFEEIIGQDAVVQILTNAIANDQLAHAYIFSGPRGTGKTSLARILAKALNCREGRSVQPCLKCDLCRRIKSGEAMDVFEIDAASNRGIDEIRDLRDKIAFAPVEGKYKIYIIDEAHMLTEPAFNALLKTIEEPPENTLFILATTEPHKIPVTIMSRCQRLDFKRITLPKIIKMLNKIAKAEGINIEEKALNLIAKNAAGGMRDAVSLLDQIYSFKGKEILSDAVLEVLGTTDVTQLFKMIDLLQTGDSGQALKYLEEIIISGKSVSQFCKDLLEHIRHLILTKAGAWEAIDLPSEQIELLKSQAEKYSMAELKRIVNLLSKAENEMRWYPNMRLILEIALVEVSGENSGESKELPKKIKKVISSSRSIPEKKEIKDEKPIVKEVEKAESPQEEAKEVVTAAYQDSEEIKTLAEIKHHWPDILNKVKQRRTTTYMLLCESEPVEMQDGNLVLKFKKNFSFHKEKFLESENLSVFKEVLGEYVRTPLNYAAVLEEAELVPEKKEVKANNSIPLTGNVKTLVDMFDGKLL